MPSKAFLVLLMATLAHGFVAPWSITGCSRCRIMASASEEYLSSTQEAIDISQAAEAVKQLKAKADVPPQFARDPKHFKRDPTTFRRMEGGATEASIPLPELIAASALAAAAFYMM